MMYDQAVDGLRLLSDVDIAMAAGGYEPNMPGEGGGGPTDGERIIEALFLDYSSPPTYQDLWESHHENGALFYDSDQNGYFDFFQIVDDNGVWSYNSDTGAWTYKAFSESKDIGNTKS